MERVHVVNQETGDATRDTVSGKRGYVKLHAIAHQAQIAGIPFLLINPISKGALKTEALAVEFLSCSELET
jgi:hypothetical protein